MNKIITYLLPIFLFLGGCSTSSPRDEWIDEQIEIFNQQDIQTSLNTLGEIPETENEYSIELGRIDFCDKGEEYTVPLCIRFIK